MSAPKNVERALRLVIPLWALYPAIFNRDGSRKDGRGQDKNALGRIPSDTEWGAGADGAQGGKKGGGKKVRISEAEDGQAPAALPEKADLSGVWKRTKTEDYDKFIIAQGGSWMKGRLAASIALEHTITQDKDLKFFRLMEKGGPINTDFIYTVDGKTVALTKISETEFNDTASYDDNVLYLHKMVQPNQQYELKVHRFLDDASTMRIVAQFIHFTAPEKNVTATSWFERTGDSPYQAEMNGYAKEREGSGTEGGAGAGGEGGGEGEGNNGNGNGNTEGGASTDEGNGEGTGEGGGAASTPTPTSTSGAEQKKRGEETDGHSNPKDFGGVWERTRNDNYDSILSALGLTYKQRKAHEMVGQRTIAILMGNSLQKLQFTETAVGSPQKGQKGKETESSSSSSASFSYDVAVCAPAQEITVLGQRYQETCSYVEPKGFLRIRQKRRDGSSENVIEMFLQDGAGGGGGGEKELVMRSFFVDFTGGKDTVEALQIFRKIPGSGSGENITLPDSMRSPSMQSSKLMGGLSPLNSVGGTDKDSMALRKRLEGSWFRKLGLDRAGGAVQVVHSLKFHSRGGEDSQDGQEREDMVTITAQGKEDAPPTVSKYIIGKTGDGGPRSMVHGQVYEESCYWEGQALVVRKSSVQGDSTIFIRRTVELLSSGTGTGEILRMEVVQKSHQTEESAESMSTFTRLVK